MTTSIREISISDKHQVRHFIELERVFMRDYPLFVSDFDNDVAHRITGKSAYFKDCLVKNIIANDGNKDVARCMALINQKYQKAKKEKVGFIGYFAAEANSAQHVKVMLEHAENWLQENGVERVIAPYNGSMWFGAGTLITDFDQEPKVPYFWAPAYYPEYFQSSGYNEEYTLWYYTINLESEEYKNALEKYQHHDSFSLRYMNKKQWENDLEILRSLMNNTFQEEWLCCDFDQQEYLEFFNPIKPIYEKENIIFAYMNGSPVGYVIGMPIWNSIVRPFKGKLHIFNLFRILLLRNKYSSVGLICIGVLDGYHGHGIATALAVKLFEFYRKKGFSEAGYYFVNDDNTPSHMLAKKLGGVGKVIAHAYDKKLG